MGHHWIMQFKNATRQTQYFILTWVIYMIAIIASTLYAYGRLEFVKSDDYQSSESIKNIENR
ncbi:MULTISPECIES: hypothetical protein [Parachlamydia]|jgi:hypothetical protein|uniref:Uncharacterized protein n=2 Tax=Parachlamydia acanthamoebae TaxID=83552 RepID=F8L0B2_PARAV|nr:hypothetical protein [Parachlamydia acanthamoebae]EFB41611.1 hypothetical protein pah_c026o039 [Parachlamydia acanthamoebae str. Hall's coccus]KIA77661.1 hypothetical protein DB43_GB00230 [Parachlamydia acanthamoebae]CCB86642.1 putative uncharacterized protein [Parachlamydia acanthamoebae UV-7]